MPVDAIAGARTRSIEYTISRWYLE
uniref:Uncharacterized protein n=1 Tax=Arundo donax TaxID=35708 RepID=A0A0A9H468_ARUDO